MAELDGSILVVHPERKQQRMLMRILGSVGRALVAADDVASLTETLRDGTPALLVIGTRTRLDAGCDAQVELAIARGCLGCIVIHDERVDVPPELFEAGSMCHLVTAPMPVLAEELFATVQKLLRAEIFGLDKYLAWGAVVGETEVTSTDDRLRAIGQLAGDVERMQIGRRQQAAAMLAADELVLNAIHNAPVDEHGRRYLREVPRDVTRTLLGRERPRIRWGCDGRWFAISVRDAYGSIEPSTIVRYVAKSLARSGQVRSEGAGAGIGLAMTYSAVTQLVFDLDPGRATEAIALVDVRPWPPASIPPLASFHLFQKGKVVVKKLSILIVVAACGGGGGGSTVETPTGAFFPGQTPYNRDISGVTPVSNSDAITAFMEGAHPPNGWGTGQMQIDFALIVNQAPSGTEKRAFTIEPDYYYPPECDDAPFPLPSGGAVEVDWQAPAPLGGLGGYDCSGYDNGDDCHILVNDPTDHRLYELYHATVRSDGSFSGGCEAIWDTSTAPTDMGRGEQCTSADAAGYAIAPLLVTPDEIFAGHVDHAVRLILPNDMIRGGTYFSPATHGTGSSGPDPDSLPYGGRMRLKADYPIDQLDPAAQVVAAAMQKYGLMLADGGNIAITMSNDELSAHSWDEVGLAPDSLSALKASDFDVILDGDPYVTEATDCTRTQITN